MSNACKIFSCLDLNLVCDIMFICDNVRLVFFSLECGSFIINSQYLRCHMLKYRWNITNFRKIEINSTISFLYICAAAVIKHCRWFICNWRKEIVQLNQHAQRAKAINKCSLKMCKHIKILWKPEGILWGRCLELEHKRFGNY